MPRKAFVPWLHTADRTSSCDCIQVWVMAGCKYLKVVKTIRVKITLHKNVQLLPIVVQLWCVLSQYFYLKWITCSTDHRRWEQRKHLSYYDLPLLMVEECGVGVRSNIHWLKCINKLLWGRPWCQNGSRQHQVSCRNIAHHRLRPPNPDVSTSPFPANLRDLHQGSTIRPIDVRTCWSLALGAGLKKTHEIAMEDQVLLLINQILLGNLLITRVIQGEKEDLCYSSHMISSVEANF